MAIAKKGMGHYGEDPTGMTDGMGCSWYYNWQWKPVDAGIKAEFIPMLWSDDFVTEESLAHVKEKKYPALLGFNEPDGHGQADMTVKEAIELWPKLMDTGLPLGSPGTTTAAPWLDEFMDECRTRNYRVEILCLHWYGDITKPDPIGDLKKYLEGYWEKYKLPIWLTEYSGADFDYHVRKTTVDDNAKFARESIRMMEALECVKRYAWFTNRVGAQDINYPTVSLYEEDLKTVTPVGVAYRDADK